MENREKRKNGKPRKNRKAGKLEKIESLENGKPGKTEKTGRAEKIENREKRKFLQNRENGKLGKTESFIYKKYFFNLKYGVYLSGRSTTSFLQKVCFFHQNKGLYLSRKSKKDGFLCLLWRYLPDWPATPNFVTTLWPAASIKNDKISIICVSLFFCFDVLKFLNQKWERNRFYSVICFPEYSCPKALQCLPPNSYDKNFKKP